MTQTKNIQSIVILTGAGISAESGLDTFRGTKSDGGGIWADHKIEDVATPEAFGRDPVLVHQFYNMRRDNLHNVEPNAAHKALARLEKEFAGDVTVITQNVDDLHERAGSSNLIHMHGELRKVWCTSCDSRMAWRDVLSLETECPSCGAKASMRPDIVWFGEMPYQMNEIYSLLELCDLFASIGTSGNVYPAAQFVQHASRHGAETIELNLEPSANHSDFDRRSYGKASEIVPEWVDRLLKEQNKR